MKINPTDKIQYLIHQVDPVSKKIQGSDSFDTVLQQVEKSSDKSRTIEKTSTRPMIGLYPDVGVLTDYGMPETAAAHKLLDALNAYQQMLGDPEATLKMIQPAVDEMASQASGTLTMLDDMPDESPVKIILRETLTHVTREIDKFNSGFYVDG